MFEGLGDINDRLQKNHCDIQVVRKVVLSMISLYTDFKKKHLIYEIVSTFFL